MKGYVTKMIFQGSTVILARRKRERERGGGKYVRKKRDKTLTYDGTFALRNKNDGVKRGTRF